MDRVQTGSRGLFPVPTRPSSLDRRTESRNRPTPKYCGDRPPSDPDSTPEFSSSRTRTGRVVSLHTHIDIDLLCEKDPFFSRLSRWVLPISVGVDPTRQRYRLFWCLGDPDGTGGGARVLGRLGGNVKRDGWGQDRRGEDRLVPGPVRRVSPASGLGHVVRGHPLHPSSHYLGLLVPSRRLRVEVRQGRTGSSGPENPRFGPDSPLSVLTSQDPEDGSEFRWVYKTFRTPSPWRHLDDGGQSGVETVLESLPTRLTDPDRQRDRE